MWETESSHHKNQYVKKSFHIKKREFKSHDLSEDDDLGLHVYQYEQCINEMFL